HDREHDERVRPVQRDADDPHGREVDIIISDYYMNRRTAYVAMSRTAILCSVSLLSFTGCARDRGVEAAAGQKAREVKTEQAQIRDVRRQVDVVGTLAAREEVVVS